MLRYLLVPLSSLAIVACQATAQTPGPAAAPSGGIQAGPSMESDPAIVATLLKLMELKDNTRPASDDFERTALKDLVRLGTPRGFHLRNRYTRLGVSLSEALAVTDDPRLKEQMLELARWERNSEIKAVALLSLAGRKEPEQIKVFDEALVNVDPGVRFAALEALELWNLPEAKRLLHHVVRTDLQPILKVYAAQALLRRGGEAGREELLRQLDSGDWLARAMAARYLGELGTGADYDLLLDRMGREQTNDFVIAEHAIACLKLFPKKTPSASVPPPSSPLPAEGEDELEALVITAPRLKIPPTALIDGRINAQLFRLLEDRANARPTEEQLQDPSIKTLNSLVSPAGFQLKTRYTELGFLLTEGLAGTSDLVLRERLLRVARQGSNPQVRAAALLAVAYNKDLQDRGLFQEALLAPEFTVRFGAVEALQVWGKPGSAQDIGNVGRLDASAFLRVYA
ncbi:MAG: HEAT repeat domain-containing protein, partial [Elusimicrobia bacterium]|nr:HEAT repeat domain-containing protein [Elusimicrobiota bacterium]